MYKKMPSLSFDKGEKSRPIAIARGGEFDGELLYLHEDDFKPKRVPKKQIDAMSISKELKSIPSRDRMKAISNMNEAIRKGISADGLVGASDTQRTIYSRIVEEQNDNSQIKLPMESFFQIVPNPDPAKREIYYLAGASGCGKSFMARGIAENYMRLFPERSVYLVSKLKEDETLDNMKVGKCKRINLDSLVSDYPELEEFKESLILFDDYDTLDKPYIDVVLKFIDDIATMGRHFVISMVAISHNLTNYKKTRLILNECSHICVYPQGASYHAIKYLLATHVGMDKDQIKALKGLGRWVMIGKQYPQYIVSEHTARILNGEWK